MQAKLLREMEIVESLAWPALLAQSVRRGKQRFAPAGTLYDHPDCFRLVQMGVAEPVDDECRDAAGLNPEQLANAQHAAKRLAAGIMPEDFDRYDAGELLGYDAAGNDIPGPNAKPVTEDDEEDE